MPQSILLPWPFGSTALQSEADTTKFRASGKKYEHVQGVPYWSMPFELALTDRLMHVRYHFSKPKYCDLHISRHNKYISSMYLHMSRFWKNHCSYRNHMPRLNAFSLFDDIKRISMFKYVEIHFKLSSSDKSSNISFIL